MPHAHTLPAQAPVSTPKPGVESRPALEAGHVAGNARDPQQSNVYNHAGRTPLGIGRREPVAERSPGVDTRPVMHPAGPVGLIRAWSDEWTSSNRGHHGVLTPGASTPPGDHLPLAPARNTFRAEPQPWDTGLIVAAPSEK